MQLCAVCTRPPKLTILWPDKPVPHTNLLLGLKTALSTHLAILLPEMLVMKILASNKLEDTGQWVADGEYNRKQSRRSLRQPLPTSTELLSVASVLMEEQLR